MPRKTAKQYNAQRRVRSAGQPRTIDVRHKILLDYEDVASLTGVPIGTLRRRVRVLTGPRLTLVGRHHRFTRKDVDAWIDALRIATEAT